MEPVPRPLRRALRALWGVRLSYFMGCDTTVAIPVEPQDEGVRLLDELLARDLSILVFVEIAEIRLGQRSVGFLHGGELGRIELAVMVAIGGCKYPVGKTLPFLAGENAVAVGVPDRRPIL